MNDYIYILPVNPGANALGVFYDVSFMMTSQVRMKAFILRCFIRMMPSQVRMKAIIFRYLICMATSLVRMKAIILRCFIHMTPSQIKMKAIIPFHVE